MTSNPFLFNIDECLSSHGASFRGIETPLWTKNKAKFIARYLQSFTYVTKHGTYIDAFAGPQHIESKDESWAAKLVMNNQPAWLRHYYLFDHDPSQIAHLSELRDAYLSAMADRQKRSVAVTEGDCNQTLPTFLLGNPIREKEATFCLLDQRSTECDWNTVKIVADHKGKSGGNKIELFYFFAQGWIDRTIKSWRIDVEERCLKWWGKSDVMSFLNLQSFERAQCITERFKNELGYKYACPFPIQKEGETGTIMFWMIHASDHPRAITLMLQAYNHIGAGGGVHDPLEQLDLWGNSAS